MLLLQEEQEDSETDLHHLAQQEAAVEEL